MNKINDIEKYVNKKGLILNFRKLNDK